jgi:beta-glucuronidase
VFDTAYANYGKRGTGLYVRTVNASSGDLRLKIAGLGLYAKAWWDGKLIGEVKLPYSSVDLDFVNPADGPHTLAIAVDNRLSSLTAPLFKPNYDFYAYGGIYRNVSIQALPTRRIERVQVTTLDWATGRVRLRLFTACVSDGAVAVTVDFDGRVATRRNVPVTGNVAELELTVPGAKPWSPEAPNLHTVGVLLGADRVIDRFGIRSIETAGRRILLNGEPIRLKGVCRHESHPEFGPVQNTHLMIEDIGLVHSLGGNFIRCVHYQHDPEFYELCDEAGMLVWAESLGWGLGEQDLHQLEPLLVNETSILGQIVANHPSVIIAGFLNECASDKKSCLPIYRKLAETLRRAAPGKLVSYASNRIKKDVCFGVCDLISVNYYPGWISPVSWSQPSRARRSPATSTTWLSGPVILRRRMWSINRSSRRKAAAAGSTGCGIEPWRNGPRITRPTTSRPRFAPRWAIRASAAWPSGRCSTRARLSTRVTCGENSGALTMPGCWMSIAVPCSPSTKSGKPFRN